jgi:hypothetical protein
VSTTFGDWVQVEGLKLAFGDLWFVVSGFGIRVWGSGFGFEVFGVRFVFSPFGETKRQGLKMSEAEGGSGRAECKTDGTKAGFTCDV